LAAVLIGLLYICLAAYLLLRLPLFKTKLLPVKWVITFFLLRVSFGLVVTATYTYYYPDTSRSDIYRYFNDAKVIDGLRSQHPDTWCRIMAGVDVNNASHFQHLLTTQYYSHPETDMVTHNDGLIRVIAILLPISASSIWVATVLLNITSFLLLLLLFKSLTQTFPNQNPHLLAIALFCLPSVLFWSSGLMKEHLLLILLSIFGLVQMRVDSSFLKICSTILIVYLLAQIKPYVAFALLTALVVYLGTANLKSVIILMLLTAGAIFLLFRYDFCTTLISKRNEFTSLATAQQSSSLLDANLYQLNCESLELIFPRSFFDVLLQPVPNMFSSIPAFAFSLEWFLITCAFTFLLFKHFNKEGFHIIRLTFSLAVFACVNFLIIGITVPIAGAIVHYRILATLSLSLALWLSVKLHKNIFV